MEEEQDKMRMVTGMSLRLMVYITGTDLQPRGHEEDVKLLLRPLLLLLLLLHHLLHLYQLALGDLALVSMLIYRCIKFSVPRYGLDVEGRNKFKFMS
ncbi:hypothetical protein PV326_005292 [Microctonus aethiopoides]|nr:hypothetical protein PV326_005292 [Microctonus aethiopoides]